MSDRGFESIEIAHPDGVMRGYEGGPRDWPVDLIFLPANGLNARAYLELLAPLTDTKRIWAIDLRGHGRTELPLPEPPLKTFAIYRDDILRVLDAAGGAPVTLGGHSLGGATSLLTAEAASGQVKSVIALDPPVLPRLFSWLIGFDLTRELLAKRIPQYRAAINRRWRFDSKKAALKAYREKPFFAAWPKQALKDYVEDGFKKANDHVELTCPRDWEAETYLGHAHNLYKALKNFPGPAHFLLAGKGALVRDSMARKLQKLGPRVNVERMEEGGHMFPMTHADATREFIARALDA